MERYRIVKEIRYNGCIPIVVYFVQVRKDKRLSSEWVNVKGFDTYSICSLRKECDELENLCDEWICRLIDCKYFINRGKVTDIKIDKEE